MQATILDLRYKMKDVLKALEKGKRSKSFIMVKLKEQLFLLKTN